MKRYLWSSLVLSQLIASVALAQFSAGKVFDLGRIRETFGREVAADWKCRTDMPASPSVFAPPRDNPQTQGDENKVYLQPLRDFEYRLSTITTDYLRSSKNGRVIANCALHWLNAWAAKDFMVREPKLKESDVNWWQLNYERSFLGASIALHYAAIGAQSGLDAGQKARVEGWLKAMALKTMSFVEYRNQKDPTHRYNNINAWSALHMVTVGVTLKNEKLKEAGLKAFRNSATQIRSDGLIRSELLRAGEGKSFWYHNYFVRPMFHVAEIMRQQGVNLFDYRSAKSTGSIAEAARRLAREHTTGMATFPDREKQISSSRPEFFRTDNTGQLDWLEIFHRRSPQTEPGVAKLLIVARAQFKDLKDVAGGALKSRLGPNATIAQGRRAP